MIYLILAPELDRVKIGKSNNVAARFKTLQTGHSEELCVVAELDKPDEYENELHLRFHNWRLRGEWFLMNPELAKFILCECQYGSRPGPGIASAWRCLQRHNPDGVKRAIAMFQKLERFGLLQMTDEELDEIKRLTATMRDLRPKVEAMLTEFFGERCDTEEENCECCRRWMALDVVFDNPFEDELKELLK